MHVFKVMYYCTFTKEGCIYECLCGLLLFIVLLCTSSRPTAPSCSKLDVSVDACVMWIVGMYISCLCTIFSWSSPSDSLIIVTAF